jgi:hypothetical protein
MRIASIFCLGILINKTGSKFEEACWSRSIEGPGPLQNHRKRFLIQDKPVGILTHMFERKNLDNSHCHRIK